MKRVLFVTFLAIGIAYAQAGAPPSFHFWSHSNIDSMANALAPQMNAYKFKSQEIGKESNHRYLVVHREGPGEAEYHATESDIVFVESGTATLVCGGKIIDPKNTAPNEIRGSGIQGGEERSIGPGDVIAIPPKLPHQVKAPANTHFNYFVVKVSE
jgi:mannose-6-phosphate isomerase-like protein (cupin superfamily)